MSRLRRKRNPGKISFAGKKNIRILLSHRKGISELTWTYILLALTLVILTVVSAPLFDAIDAGSKSYAKSKADEIAGVINSAKNSPSSTFSYTVPIPRNCFVEINNDFVYLQIGKNNGTSYIVQNSVNVEGGKFQCSETVKRTLQITKNEDTLTVVPGG